MNEASMLRIYERSPVFLQNAMLNAYGVKERRLRHHGRYHAYLDEVRRTEWLSAEELEADQSARLRRLVSHCEERIPYYRDLFSELGLAAADIAHEGDLKKLPVLEKEEIRRAPERFCVDGSSRGLLARTTGGTTGTPLRYFVTPEAVQFNYAIYEARFRNWAGVSFGERMSSMNGRVIVPSHQSGPPYWRRNYAFNQQYLSIYHLTPENLPSYVKAMSKFQPAVIVGYPSAVHLLATHILASEQQGVITPKAVLLSSETLFPWMRSDIEQAFQCRVFDGYSQGELTIFISECPAGSMHISPDCGVVEFVRIEGETELVATGLSNFGMPLLRYRTRDVAEQGDGSDCACGRKLPTIRKLVGRADDLVMTPDGRSVGAAPMSLAFQSIPGIRESQVRQTTIESVDVDIVTVDGAREPDQGIEAALLRELRARLGPALQIAINRVDRIERTGAGKRQLIVSTLHQ